MQTSINTAARTSKKTRLVTTLGVAGALVAAPLIGGLATANAASVSTWDKVAQLESSGDWHINTGNGFYGGLQFTQSTWNEFGGQQYAARADLATKAQQITIAEKVLKVQGPGAWPNTSGPSNLTKNGPTPSVDTGSSSSTSTAKKSTSTAKSTTTKKATAPTTSTTSSTTAAKTTSYSVVKGDTLYKIAKAKKITGGWTAIYKANRAVIGNDPDYIEIGQKLSLNGKSTTATKTSTSAASKTNTTSSTTTKAKTSTTAKTSSTSTSTKANSSGYVAPVSGALGTAFGTGGKLWSSGSHTGQDFRVGTGTSVKAITTGTVVKTGSGGAYGNEIVIRHADGKYSQYAHLSHISVSVGSKVSTGQQIGLSGATGNVTGPHLHFEIRTTASYGSGINPLSYLRAHGVNI